MKVEWLGILMVLVSLGAVSCTTLPASPDELESVGAASGFAVSDALSGGLAGSDANASTDAEHAPSWSDTQVDIGPTGYECEPLDERPCFTACGGAGIQRCLKTWQSCVAAEICDGDDEDCDGLIDEGVANACGGCGAVPHESCNGLDDDCDDVIDEDQSVLCPDSGICLSGMCAPPSCEDGVVNATETDVDCGGHCPPCGGGEGCEEDADCQSLECLVDAQEEANSMICAEPDYMWDVGDFGPCSSTCGEGTQQRDVHCKRSDGLEVSASYCDEEMPAESQVCHSGAECAWATGQWSACSVGCGEGSAEREVFCHGHNGVVDDALCDASMVPETSGPCVGLEGCAWSTSAWGACSNLCGDGTQTRSASCAGPDGEVDSSLCLDAPPLLEQACTDTTACTWEIGAWGACSVGCGQGTRTRLVTCHGVDGAEVDAALCAGETPPSSEPCVATQGCQWDVGGWTQCSVSCGEGARSRTVQCSGPEGVVADTLCGGTPPVETESCIESSGCAWSAGSWGACSVSCGEGVKTRSVGCTGAQGDVGDALCGGTPPAASEPCIESSGCSWSTGSWGTCSTDCGTGVELRTVSCSGPTGAVDDSLCSGDAPPSQQNCTASTACSWAVGDWGTCSAPCGGGQQSRSVTCVASGGAAVAEPLCGSKPAGSQSCNTQACTVYRTSWGSGVCWSGSCGGGYGSAEGCPSGYMETGFGQACGNPNAYSGATVCGSASKGSSDWTLCRFVEAHGWGCPGGFPNMGVSVRQCSWQ